MKKEDKINIMLDNADKALSHANNVHSRMQKITRLMPLIKSKSGLVQDNPSSYDSTTYCEGFLDGYESKINSVWHDFDININNDDDVVLLLRNGKIVDYDDDWEEYYSPAVKWAYKKDLLPNTENN